jgi:hypothetical protein
MTILQNSTAQATSCGESCDIAAITRNVAGFAARDRGLWDELRDLYHPDALMAVSWYSGPIAGFIEKSEQMMAAGSSVATKHMIGTSRIRVAGNRANADTDVTILIRTKVGPVEVDMTSYLRFFDRFERRGDGIWRVASRTAIYEKDRMDPVAPSLLYPLVYRLGRFHRFPKPYRHLAAGLVRNGQALSTSIIEAGSLEEIGLVRDARLWLDAMK